MMGSATKTTCEYCGANPVPHRLTKLSAWFSLFTRPRHTDSRWYRFSAYASQYCFEGVLGLFTLLHIARTTNDLDDALSERGHVLWEEAQKRGLEMYGYKLFGRRTDTYRAKIHNKVITFAGIPRPLLSISGSESWLDDKAELKNHLSTRGIPTPRGAACRNFEEAQSLFNTLEKPVIVKPIIGSRGRHTTTNIHTLEQLKDACAVALQIAPRFVVEEHLVGSVYRATMIGGELIAVLGGDPPRVRGDGVSTIRELITLKNETRDARISAVDIGPPHIRFLERTGYTLDSVPPDGKEIDLLEKIGIRYGGNSVEVTPITHPETVRILTNAARVVADPIIGFDFIIEDVTRSPHQQKWGIIECNALPFINLHHFPIEGAPVNVAARVWDYVEANISDF